MTTEYIILHDTMYYPSIWKRFDNLEKAKVEFKRITENLNLNNDDETYYLVKILNKKGTWRNE